MDYRGPDLDLRTSRWAASSTDPAGRREAAPAQQQQAQASANAPARPGQGRTAPIWVDETVLASANQAYDVAVAYRSPEVQLIHLLLAMTRIEASVAQLDARGVGVAALRRDCAITIAAEAPVAQEAGVAPRRSAELEDVLRLAATRASHANRPANVEDIVQVLCEVGGELYGAEVIVRHFPRAARSLWGAPPAGPAANHLLDFAVTERSATPAAQGGDPPSHHTIDEAAAQRVLDRVAASERHVSERIGSIEALLSGLPAQPASQLSAIEQHLHAIEERLSNSGGDAGFGVFDQRLAAIEHLLEDKATDAGVNAIDQRLGAIELGLQSKPVNEGVVAIDPAITDRLWSIEHALSTERTERTSSVTALSDEITGVRSAVRLAAQAAEQAHASLMEQFKKLSSSLNQSSPDMTTGVGERFAAIEQALDIHAQRTAELHSVYTAELSEVHDALMKISANQHTLAGSIDHWRNNESAEIQHINSRIGAVHEDGAQRLSVIEKLSSDVETLSQLVIEERSKPPTTFRQWLFGTEEWAKPGWRLPKLPRPSLKWPRLARLRPLRRRVN